MLGDLTSICGTDPAKYEAAAHYASLLDDDERVNLGGRSISRAQAAFIVRPLAQVLRTIACVKAALAVGVSAEAPDPTEIRELARDGCAQPLSQALDQLDPALVEVQACRAAIQAGLMARQNAAATSSPPPARSFRIDRNTKLPPTQVRPTITSRHQRGLVTMTIAEPAAGKSTLLGQTALAITTGRPDIIGEAEIDRLGAAVIVSNEDGGEEWLRRLKAANHFFNIAPVDRVHPLELLAGDDPIVIMERDGKGPPRPAAGYQVIDAILKELRDAGAPAAFLGIDTLASVTRGLDENDAGDMQAVMALVTRLARKHQIAVEVIHHSSKAANGRAGDQHSTRGSSAVTGAARMMHTLTGLSEDERAKCGLTPGEAKRWVRVDGAKASYGALRGTMWFERRSVTIPAFDPRFPNALLSETAPVLVASAAGPRGPAPQIDLKEVREFIRAGYKGDPAHQYSPQPLATEALHKALAAKFGLTLPTSRQLVNDMTARGELVVGTTRKKGKKRKSVSLAAEKSDTTIACAPSGKN
jgi:RecA-family ATPase